MAYTADHLFTNGWDLHFNYRYQYINFKGQTIYGNGFDGTSTTDVTRSLFSLSGSLLVFKDELVRAQLPATLHAFRSNTTATPEAVLQHLQDDQPGAVAVNLQIPSPMFPVFLLEGKDPRGAPARWIADPVTGTLQTANRSWVDWVHDLHYYLLLPKAWGMQANGVGALALLVLAASGLVLWWPGTRVWTRGLRVNMRAGWRRINYDLHSAIGFWTLRSSSGGRSPVSTSLGTGRLRRPSPSSLQ